MNLVELGRIGRPHGLKGELKVHPHWVGGSALGEARALFVGIEGEEPRLMKVEAARAAGKTVLLKLEGVDDRDAAAEYTGGRVAVERATLPEPEPDEFYLVDLLGCEVVGPEGTIGEVVEIRTHPTIDTMLIRSAEGQVHEHPIGEQWLEDVDLDQARVTLVSTDGLI